MFDSPLEWCAVCNNWIAIDQTFVECARQYGCVPARCPVAPLLKGSNRAAAPAAAASAKNAAAAG